MDTPKIFESEYRFCLILWVNEPICRSELAEPARNSWTGPKPPPTIKSGEFNEYP